MNQLSEEFSSKKTRVTVCHTALNSVLNSVLNSALHRVLSSGYSRCGLFLAGI